MKVGFVVHGFASFVGTHPTHKASTTKNHDTITFTLVQKNTRSLTSDDRIHEFIQKLNELKDTHWDVVAVNGTWRTQMEQLWTTREGHT